MSFHPDPSGICIVLLTDFHCNDSILSSPKTDHFLDDPKIKGLAEKSRVSKASCDTLLMRSLYSKEAPADTGGRYDVHIILF